MNKKVKSVKDKEGVVFMLQTYEIDPAKLERESSLYVRSFLERELMRRNVYPLNERVGISGDIKTLTFFISSMIEGFNKRNEFFIK
jgi:hypothetical protein